MNRATRAIGALWSAVKSMNFSAFAGSPIWRMAGLPQERDYSRLVGDGSNNSIVQACIQWMCRTFPEAPPAMWKVDNDGVHHRQPKHAMVRLLRFPTATPDKPGGYYSGVHLWMATITSRVVDGNAYWLKVRSDLGRVVQLWYVPHWMMEPRWPQDGSEFISHYDYKVNGQTYKIAPTEVVHFREGLDPDNPRKGKTPLTSLMREIFTDEEAARFSASLLRNLGIPGLLVAPAPSQGDAKFKPFSQEDAQFLEERMDARFSGDKRGKPLVMTGPTQITQFGFSPKDLDLQELRHLPEERVTAVLGLPAAVVGLGAGLRFTKVGATMAELRDQAWQTRLIPDQRIIAAEIQTQLLPDFTSNLEDWEFGFDIKRVKVLQDDILKLANTHRLLVSAGIEKRAEARIVFDLPVTPEDEVYIPQPGVQATADGGDAATAPGAGAGDGGLTVQQQIDQLRQAIDDLTASA